MPYCACVNVNGVTWPCVNDSIAMMMGASVWQGVPSHRTALYALVSKVVPLTGSRCNHYQQLARLLRLSFSKFSSISELFDFFFDFLDNSQAEGSCVAIFY